MIPTPPRRGGPPKASEWDPNRTYRVVLSLCGRCLRGDGGECHTPDCGLCWNRAPDLALTAEQGWPIETVVESWPSMADYFTGRPGPWDANDQDPDDQVDPDEANGRVEAP